MRKIVFCILLIGYTSSYAQTGMILDSRDFAEGSTFSGMISSKSSGRSLNYDEIIGSPYSNINFSSAKIAENYERTPVRYNSYADQIEFEKDGVIMVLPKQSPFERIEMTLSKEVIVLLKTEDDLDGYFYEVQNGKNSSLYKKIKTKFLDVIPASNTYSSDKPAMFKSQDPIYYIKTSNGFIKKPKNIKDIIEKFPAKKDLLNSFAKNNKVKFNNEEDLIGIVSLLNQ